MHVWIFIIFQRDTLNLFGQCTEKSKRVLWKRKTNKLTLLNACKYSKQCFCFLFILFHSKRKFSLKKTLYNNALPASNEIICLVTKRSITNDLHIHWTLVIQLRQRDRKTSRKIIARTLLFLNTKKKNISTTSSLFSVSTNLLDKNLR